jgi:hypothetical protein
LAALAALVVIAAFSAPSTASAAACAGGTTAWTGLAGNGSFGDALNWDNGGPSAACDASITMNGTYEVLMTSGASMQSLTIGGSSGTQTLRIRADNANTNLDAMTTGLANGAHGAIILDCLGGGCAFGPGNAPTINVGASTLTNNGSITVTAAATGTGGFIGNVTNTGTIQINGNARHTGGTLLNQGPINIATGVSLTSSGSSCGAASVIVNNDAGGQINATGTGTLSALNYVQGAGTTSGTDAVIQGCGSLSYTGAGASSVLAPNGFNLSGTMSSGQSLRIRADSSNTNAVASGGFTNNGGTITLDCPGGGCSGGPGGAPMIDVGSNTLTNTGTITVTPAASGNGGFTGNVTNAGTLQINGNARQALGSGVTTSFVQTAGATVVASGVSLNLSGNTVAGLNLNGGVLRGEGTITGSVNNTGGDVSPGSSPGTLTVSGNYTQGSGGTLKVAVAGTTAGQFSKLNVGGNAILVGPLVLQPTVGYAASAAPGDSVAFLSYGGSRTGTFSSTTASPPLAGGKTYSAVYDDLNKRVNAVVVAAPPPVDSDGDGVPDSSDTCPNQVGPPSNNGCPLPPADSDADGVPDSSDLCPDQAGPPPNNGCPLAPADSDGDGVPDSSDTCPNQAGPASNNGCPDDKTAPETTIDKGPKHKTTKRKAKFRFSATEAGTTFECSLDKKAFTPCVSPLKLKAKPGKHLFQVRATDPAGNVDDSPASLKWKVRKS